MSNLQTSTPTVAFFGATGGVTNSCLVHALKSGLHAVALVRTPQKLRDQLLAQGLDESTLSTRLTVTQGNALDVEAVKKTLLPAGGQLVETVITGLGGVPSLQFSIWRPLQLFTLDNPRICETAAQTLVTALRELYAQQPRLAQKKPRLAFVSTTGVSRGPEDVPFAMRFFYHQMLTVPHADKREMENIFRGTMEGGKENAVFSSVTGVKPTLLTGEVQVSDAAGLEKVRAGTEPKPEMGYTIKRADVGEWMFVNLVKEGEERARWEGEMVTLTS